MKEKDLKQIEEVCILNDLHQGIQMGLVGIHSVLDKIEHQKLLNHLKEQKLEYERLDDQVIHICKGYGIDDESITKWESKMSELMTEVKLKFSKGDDKIVQMMIDGTNKGIQAVYKSKNEYQGDDEELKELIDDILKTEEHNLKELNIYL